MQIMSVYLRCIPAYFRSVYAKITWYETVTQNTYQLIQVYFGIREKGNIFFQNPCSATSLVNNCISLLDLRGQLV